MFKMSMTGACLYADRTRGAIYAAIKENRLVAEKGDGDYGRWTITKQAMDDYIASRYARERVQHKGQLVYDKKGGRYSVHDAIEILGCKLQHLYYAIRTKKIASKKIGGRLTLHINDILDYRPTMRICKHCTGNWG